MIRAFTYTNHTVQYIFRWTHLKRLIPKSCTYVQTLCIGKKPRLPSSGLVRMDFDKSNICITFGCIAVSYCTIRILAVYWIAVILWWHAYYRRGVSWPWRGGAIYLITSPYSPIYPTTWFNNVNDACKKDGWNMHCKRLISASCGRVPTTNMALRFISDRSLDNAGDLLLLKVVYMSHNT